MAPPPRPRLAVTLGDPRGIGPEVVAGAIGAGPLEAEVVLVGPDDQLNGIPARSRLGIGHWGQGSGEELTDVAVGIDDGVVELCPSAR